MREREREREREKEGEEGRVFAMMMMVW